MDPTGLKLVPIGDGWSEDDQSGVQVQNIDENPDDWTTNPDGTIDTGTTTILLGHHPSGGGDVTGPSDANDFGIGGVVDNYVTFGTVTNAGNVAGAYDSHHASRIAVFGAGALAAATIVAAGASRGEDAAVVDAERGIGGWITKDVFSTLEQKVGKADLRKFVAALKKGVVGPRGESGIKRLNRPVGDFTHELKIGGSGNRILGKLGQWEGQAKYIFSELSGHLD